MKCHYELPNSLVPEGSKLKSGSEMVPKMTGAYYGSSLEYSVHVFLQFANGKDIECPAEDALREIVKPKYAHGEFGAEIVSENQDFPESKREISRSVVELATIEEVRAVRQTIDRWVSPQQLTGQLRYVNRNGNTITYDQLLASQKTHKAGNDEVQKRKDKYLLDHNLAPTYVGAKKVRPALPDWALAEISKLNEEVWTATGVNLILQYSGIHTIARDSNFFTGSLDQAGLDALASKLDYKEYDSFLKGTLRNARLSIPIQSKGQLRTVLNWLQEHVGYPAEWPEEIKKSKITLVKTPN